MNEEFQKIVGYALKQICKKLWFEELLRERILKRYPATSSNVLDEVIEWLKEESYLNDAENALRYAQFRLETKPQGVFKLRFDLAKKKIDRSVIDQTLQQMNIDEYSLAQEALELKYGKNRSKDLREKMVRFLQGRGFCMDVIVRIMT